MKFERVVHTNENSQTHLGSVWRSAEVLVVKTFFN
jgi:hypothetical protein